MNDMERLQELEKILTVNCGQYENNCNSCPYYAECEEYCKLSGIYHIVNSDKKG